jgi:hypothetical protein
MANGMAKAMVTGLAAIMVGLFMQAFAIAQTPQAPGWTLGLSLGTGWTSNPIESNRRVKGDVSTGFEATLARRFALWQGANLALTAQIGNEFYLREQAESINRGMVSAALTQEFAGFFASLSAAQRKSMNRDLNAHESASRELAFGLGRNIMIAEGWTLNLFGRIARRYLEDGTEDQFRAGVNATLTHRRGSWIMRFGGGYGYVLEDKTPILPRINDRTASARLGLAYEWTKDHEVGVRFAFTRTYSSYTLDRYKAYAVQPQVSASWRF